MISIVAVVLSVVAFVSSAPSKRDPIIPATAEDFGLRSDDELEIPIESSSSSSSTSNGSQPTWFWQSPAAANVKEDK